MRLRRLELRNYRRHVETRIEFPDGVTALVGANGAGKSTILEAFGFALFGTDALRTSKTLLRYDAAPPGDAVSVLAEFELAGQAISIHRELRGKSLTPSASLSIDGAVIVPQGAGSAEAATQQIRRRLGMDADAFFTSIIARQGELAALSTQSPADRKRLILRMLGIDRLDAAIVKAREARRDTDVSVKTLRSLIPDRSDIEKQLATSTVARDAATTRGRELETQLVAARAALATAEKGLAAIQQNAERRRDGLAKVDALRRELLLHERAAAAANAALTEANAASARVATLAPLAETYPKVQEELIVAQQASHIATQRANALTTIQNLETRLAVARKRSVEAPAESPPAIEPLEAAVQLAQQNGERLGAALEVARAALAAADARLEHLAHLGAGAPCPTCERPLGDLATSLQTEMTQTARKARSEGETLARDVALAKREVAASRDALKMANAARQRHEILIIEAAAHHREVAELEQRLLEARTALPPESPKPDLVAMRRRLDGARVAHETRSALTILVQRIPDLNLGAQVATLEVAGHKEQFAAAERELAALPDATAALAAAHQLLLAAQRKERQTELDLQATKATLAVSEQRLAELKQRIADATAAVIRLTNAELDLREWTALTDGRNGLLERFRDSVVDRIGPSIQAEASRLLAAFTGGRYSELLLDADYGLYLSDGGVRYSLERFSGGEQDVAHLALRLAVSRLLAERAGGVELRFLALDEVFGHLDEERRGHVVAALHSLSGLYAQVLVVSHLASLNDALDQAITVHLVDGESKVTLRND